MVDYRRHRVLSQLVVSSLLQTGTRFTLVGTRSDHPVLDFTRGGTSQDILATITSQHGRVLLTAECSEPHPRRTIQHYGTHGQGLLQRGEWNPSRCRLLQLDYFGLHLLRPGTVLLSSKLLKSAVAMYCSQVPNEMMQRC